MPIDDALAQWSPLLMHVFQCPIGTYMINVRMSASRTRDFRLSTFIYVYIIHLFFMHLFLYITKVFFKCFIEFNNIFRMSVGLAMNY